MQHFRKRILIPFLIALIAATPISAQTPEASPVPVTMDGLIEGVSRQYTTDPQLGTANDALLIITAHIFRFDSEDAALASWESLTANATQPLVGTLDPEADGPDIEETSIDDIGDRTHAVWLSATNDAEGVTGHFRLLYVLDGDYLYLITAIAGSEDAPLLADDIARAMVERDVSNTSANFNPDGTSTGDMWDKFPDPADDAIASLIAYRDTQTTGE